SPQQLLTHGINPKSIDPKPAEARDDGKINWELKRIDSVTKASSSFVLDGLNEAEYDESDVYVSGINPGLVIGAEPLPGDWELNYAEFEGEEGAVPEAAEEEGEIDYDEREEALEDEEETESGGRPVDHGRRQGHREVPRSGGVEPAGRGPGGDHAAPPGGLQASA